ncbi:MAG: YkuS family protein [bacterium]|nr:YkuS family protein [Bacillota bacterium]
MAERIAVEEGLSNIKEHLSRHGYQVVGFDDGLHDAEAVVISGGDRDFLGFTEPHTGAPVISARGRSPQEVLEDLRRRL